MFRVINWEYAMLNENILISKTSDFLPVIEHMKIICGDEDHELLSNMIEGELDLDGVVGNILEFILADEADVDGLKMFQRKISDRRKRLEMRIGRMRTLLASVITMLPARKYRHPLAQISAFDVDAQVIIHDESAIPSQFWIPQDPKLDESKIRRYLLDRSKQIEALARVSEVEERQALRRKIDRECPDVPGATLGNGEISVRIRVV